MQRYYYEWRSSVYRDEYTIIDRTTDEVIGSARDHWKAQLITDALNKANK